MNNVLPDYGNAHDVWLAVSEPDFAVEDHPQPSQR